jgi:type IV pilus assembly protein PilO
MTGALRKVVFVAFLVGLAWAGYHFMIKPANIDLAQTRLRNQAKRAKLAEFEEATVAAQDMAKQMEQLKDAVAFFESKLPPTNEIHKVLEKVTVIAQKQGLKPKTIRTLNRKLNSGYVEQPLIMELDGNFRSFYSFLLEMEKLPRIMKVRKLDLSKKNQLEGQISAKCVVSVFFQA